MNNFALMPIDASRKKAVTAIGFGMPSGAAWQQFIIKDFILLGGGSPIIIGRKIIGAIGVSGGHYVQDEECVRSARRN